MNEELDEFGIPIKDQPVDEFGIPVKKSTGEVDEFGIPVKKKVDSFSLLTNSAPSSSKGDAQSVIPGFDGFQTADQVIIDPDNIKKPKQEKERNILTTIGTKAKDVGFYQIPASVVATGSALTAAGEDLVKSPEEELRKHGALPTNYHVKARQEIHQINTKLNDAVTRAIEYKKRGQFTEDNFRSLVNLVAEAEKRKNFLQGYNPDYVDKSHAAQLQRGLLRWALDRSAQGSKLSENLVNNLSDINDPLDAINWLAGSLTEAGIQIPATVLSFGSAAIGQEIGSIYMDNVQRIAEERGISPEDVINQDLDEPASALAFAAVASVLDFVGAKGVMTIGKKELRKSLAARSKAFLRSAHGAGMTEGKTETAQTFLEQVGAGRDIDVEEGVEAFAKGYVGGSGIHSIQQSIPKSTKQSSQELTDKIMRAAPTEEVQAAVKEMSDSVARDVQTVKEEVLEQKPQDDFVEAEKLERVEENESTTTPDGENVAVATEETVTSAEAPQESAPSVENVATEAEPVTEKAERVADIKLSDVLEDPRAAREAGVVLSELQRELIKRGNYDTRNPNLSVTKVIETANKLAELDGTEMKNEHFAESLMYNDETISHTPEDFKGFIDKALSHPEKKTSDKLVKDNLATYERKAKVMGWDPNALQDYVTSNITDKTAEFVKSSEQKKEGLPKEIQDLYSQSATLRFTENALKQQMGKKTLVGKAKKEYDKVVSDLAEVESKLTAYEERSTPKIKEEVKPEPKIEKGPKKVERVEAQDEYGSYLLGEIKKKAKDKFSDYTEGEHNRLVQQYNDALDRDGKKRADAMLEEVYVSYVPQAVRASAYQAIRNEFKSKSERVAPSKVEEAKKKLQDRIKAVKEKFADLNDQELGAIYDPKAKAQKMYDLHRELVGMAKDVINLGVATAQEFAEVVGRKMDNFLERAWGDAQSELAGQPVVVESSKFFEVRAEGTEGTVGAEKIKTGDKKLSKYFLRMRGDDILGEVISKEDGTYEEGSLNKGMAEADNIYKTATEKGEVDSLADEFIQNFGGVHDLIKVKLGENLQDHYMNIGDHTRVSQIFQRLKAHGTKGGQIVQSFNTGRGEARGAVTRIISNHTDEKTERIGREAEKELKKLRKEVQVTKEELDRLKDVINKKVANLTKPEAQLKRRIEARTNKVASAKNKLNSLKVKTDGQLNNFTHVLGAKTWNIAIDTINASLDAGLSLTNAIDKAITEVNKLHKKTWDEQAFRALIETELKSEKDTLNATDPKKLINKGLKEEGKTLNDIIDSHYTDIEQTGRRLSDRLALGLGLDDATAKRLADDIQKTLNNMVRERQMKVLSERIGSEKIPIPKEHKNKKDLLDKIIADINMGALSDDIFTDLFADFYGFSRITPEVKRLMLGYVDRLERLANEPEIYKRVVNDFWNDLKKTGVEKFTISEVLLDMLYHGILSGFTTFARTQKGSLLTSAASIVTTSIASPLAAPRALAEFGKGLPEGVKTAWDIMSTGFSADDYKDFKPKGDSYVSLKVRTPYSELVKRKDFPGTLMKTAYTLLNVMIRSYRAWDALLKSGNKRFNGYMIEYNRDLGKAAGEAYSVYEAHVEKQLQDQADESIAKLKAMGEKIPVGFRERKVSELREKLLGDNIAKRMNQRSSEGVLMSDPHGLAGRGYRWIQGQLAQEENDSKLATVLKLLGRSTFPIVRVPANFINMAIDYSPAGAWRAVRRNDSGGRGYFEYRDGIYDMTPEERTIQFVKAITGTAVFTTMAIMLFDLDDEEGIILDENAPFQVYGRGMDKWKDNESIHPNWKQYSIRYKRPDGEWSDFYSFIDSPIGAMLAPIGDMSDRVRFRRFKKKVDSFTRPYEEQEKDGISDYALVALNGTIGFLMSQSYQQGIRDVRDVLLPENNDWSNSGEKLEQMAIRPAKSILLPNLYQQMYNYHKAYIEKPEKYSKGIIDRAIKGTPFIESYLLNDDVDIFGMPIIKKFELPAIPDDVIHALKDNMNIREGIKEWQLIHKYPEVIVSAFRPPKRLLNGKLFKDEDILEYKRIAGKTFREIVNDQYEELSKMPPDELQFVLDILKENAHKVAVGELTLRSEEGK
jgi:hypothetical protein